MQIAGHLMHTMPLLSGQSLLNMPHGNFCAATVPLSDVLCQHVHICLCVSICTPRPLLLVLLKVLEEQLDCLRNTLAAFYTSCNLFL